MREQKGIDTNTFKRRASLPPEERTYSSATRRYTAPVAPTYVELDEEGEEVSARAQTRTSARRYDLAPYAKRGERRTEELPRRGKHSLFYIGISMLVMLAFLYAYITVPQTLQKWSDDRTYGYPRTYQTDANVGHGDGSFPVDHFIAVNLNGRIEVLEIPQGDTDTLHPHLYLIARLALQGSDLVPVTVSFADMNGDGKPDLVVTFNGTQWILFNNGTAFVPKL